MAASGSHSTVSGGLLSSRENQPLKGFAIAGEDRKFHWADATIDKNNRGRAQREGVQAGRGALRVGG